LKLRAGLAIRHSFNPSAFVIRISSFSEFVSIRGEMKNRSELHFVVITGIVNFFADFTYEGARGIVGPFLGSLGASAAILGLVAGLGKFMGYALRSASGYFADKFQRHWVFAFLGNAINTLAGPGARIDPVGPAVRQIRRECVFVRVSRVRRRCASYFLGTFSFALVGMILCGIGMSAQGALFQAMLTGVIASQKRSTAFGLFDTGFGAAWFLGSAAMGFLYDRSVMAVALFQ